MSEIFVQIASYRDPELAATLQDAIEKADYPDRLAFGVVWQGKVGMDPVPLHHLPVCRMLLVDADRSRGVGWARAKTQSLWEGEAYTLQIDSHMRFVRGWDELLIRMLHQCASDRPILTAYPPGYTPPSCLHSGEPTRLGASHFNDDGILCLESRLSLIDYAQPQLGAFMAAGFWFAASQLIQDVPYDPHLYFVGEEISLSVRAWTHGWDIFHPNQVVCYHEYTRPGKPRHWEDHPDWWRLSQKATQRVHQLLGQETANTQLGIYGLGRQRSLKDYESFSGVNFQRRQLTQSARNGRPNWLNTGF
jgi:hypothetical protein